jgi:hypothetical protein
MMLHQVLLKAKTGADAGGAQIESASRTEEPADSKTADF